MFILYIIGGLFLMGLAVFFLDKRENTSLQLRQIEKSRQEIEKTNQELDQVIVALEELNEPISKLSQLSKKVLSYLK